jgi:hypothetical protein
LTTIQDIKDLLERELRKLEDDDEFNKPMIRTRRGIVPNYNYKTIKYLRVLLNISSHYEDYY